MTPQELIDAAKRQQELTGNPAAVVSLVLPGRCPPSCRKRLFGKAGPWGHVVNETRDSVTCLFPADEIIAMLGPLLANDK